MSTASRLASSMGLYSLRSLTALTVPTPHLAISGARKSGLTAEHATPTASPRTSRPPDAAAAPQTRAQAAPPPPDAIPSGTDRARALWLQITGAGRPEAGFPAGTAAGIRHHPPRGWHATAPGHRGSECQERGTDGQ